jgi:hypothetical protein
VTLQIVCATLGVMVFVIDDRPQSSHVPQSASAVARQKRTAAGARRPVPTSMTAARSTLFVRCTRPAHPRRRGHSPP